MLTTTQLNTGYSVALVHRQMARPPSTTLSGSSEPAFHGSVPAGAIGLSLFRFEGATLCRVGPGDVRRRAIRPALFELSSLELLGIESPGCGRTAHPVRAPVGRLFRCSFVVQRDVRPRRAPFSPLRIPKRARASLFSKLQRANGGCLGA